MPRLATLYCSDFVKAEDGDRCRGWAAGVCGAQYRAEFIKRNIRSQQDPSASQRVGGGGGGGGVCRCAPYFTPAGRRMRRRCRRAPATSVIKRRADGDGCCCCCCWRRPEVGDGERERSVESRNAGPQRSRSSVNRLTDI